VTYLQSIILGAIQGLTEDLPVSSDGHRVLAQEICGLRPPNPVALDVPARSLVLAGPVVAAITGWFAIDLPMRAVRIGSLRGFALYCWIVRLSAVMWGGVNGIGG